MHIRAESGSNSNSISRIFATSGLTLIASNKFSKKSKAKWMIRCNSCNELVTRKQALMHRVIYSLDKVWHREHFNCISCKCPVGYNGRPFREYRSNRNYPICIDCYMEEYHPRCNVCNKALRETCIRAMNKLWHRCCFTCTKCHSPFGNGEFLIYNEKPYDIDCYYLTKYENELTSTSNIYIQGSVPVSDHFALEKPTQKSQDIISEKQFPPTIQNTEAGRIIRNSSSFNTAAVPSTATSVNHTSNLGEVSKQTRSIPLETSSKLSESYASPTSTVKSAMPSSLTTTIASPTTTDTAALPTTTLSESSK